MKQNYFKLEYDFFQINKNKENNKQMQMQMHNNCIK